MSRDGPGAVFSRWMWFLTMDVTCLMVILLLVANEAYLVLLVVVMVIL